jgi:hypothetical protein
MEVAVSRMSLRNLRVYGMHDIEGYKLISGKYFGDLVTAEEPKENPNPEQEKYVRHSHISLSFFLK